MKDDLQISAYGRRLQAWKPILEGVIGFPAIVDRRQGMRWFLSENLLLLNVSLKKMDMLLQGSLSIRVLVNGSVTYMLIAQPIMQEEGEYPAVYIKRLLRTVCLDLRPLFTGLDYLLGRVAGLDDDEDIAPESLF